MNAAQKLRSEKAINGCLSTLFTIALRALAGGWALMVGLGVIHHELAAGVNPVGYWPCVVLAWALSMVGAIVTGRGLPLKEGTR